MKVQELFGCINTDTPRILIYDNEDNVIYTKHSNIPIGKFKYYECNVAWIYRADCDEICIRLES